MKKVKAFLLNYATLLYFELIFKILIFKSINIRSIINIVLFVIPVALIVTLVTNIFKEKVNKIIIKIIYFLFGIWFSLQFIFYKIFSYFFTFNLIKLTDQVMDFKGEAIKLIIKYSYGLIIFFLPFVLLIIFKKKYSLKKNKKKGYIILGIGLVISIAMFIVNVKLQKGTYEAYSLYHDVNDNSLNIEKLGVLDAGMLDVYRCIFGFDEKIIILKPVDKEEKKEEEIIEYGYNTLNLTLPNGNDRVNTITEYVSSDSGTKKNKYTGLFKNKNLIYITAESFYTIGIDETLTPTLYKMVNSGFKFNNFYTSYALSTIGGEFQSLTGLYADSSILSLFRSGNNSFPFGLGNIFKNNGYNTYAYHNHYATFQDRNIYLKSMGFDNYLGCYNGMEKKMDCSHWPNSDVDMINGTYTDYINSEHPFMTYYMTVSGHFEYTYGGNYIVKKNWNLVKDLPYTDKVKGYMATQIELDRALEILINKLEEANKLDDTLFVILGDHYPYNLSIREVNERSTYERDEVVEVNHNSLIIWNNKLDTVEVDKVCMSIDVIPTVYNLLGLDFDSRLFVGKDILSEEPGIAIFNNRSWVTDRGTYFANTGNTTAEIDDEYINNMNNIVSNKMNISKYIILSNYYSYFN